MRQSNGRPPCSESALFAQWIAPAGGLGGPLLIVFLGLFVVASMATRLVPAGTRIGPKPPTFLFLGSLVLLLSASAVPTLVMPLRKWQVGWGNWMFVASLVIVGVAVLAFGMATQSRIRVDVRYVAGQPIRRLPTTYSRGWNDWAQTAHVACSVHSRRTYGTTGQRGGDVAGGQGVERVVQAGLRDHPVDAVAGHGVVTRL